MAELLYLAKTNILVIVRSTINDIKAFYEVEMTRKPVCEAQNYSNGNFKKGGLMAFHRFKQGEPEENASFAAV